MDTHQIQCLINDQHPSLPGHFPGNPVVPGVVILDEIITALAQWQPQLHIKGFSTVKFLRPLLPNEPFSVEFNHSKTNRMKFECKKSQTVFASGLINLGSAAEG
ncbi:hypothetical protein [Kaarinaea lacus]